VNAEHPRANPDDEYATEFIGLPDDTASERRVPVLSVLAGARARLTITIEDSPIVIGPAQHYGVWIEAPGISREHLRMFRNSIRMVTITDLMSTNGTFVNHEKVTGQALVPGDQVQLGPETVLKFEYQSLVENQYHDKHHEQAIRDNLTGLYDRRHFLAKLREEVLHVLRENRRASMIKLMVDDFTSLTSDLGHGAGRMVLRRLAKLLSMGTRNGDLLARWGEKKFAILIHGGELETAIATAERLRKAVANYVLDWDGKLAQITISVGVASSDTEELSDMEDLLAKVDEHLTQALNRGGNTVVAPEPTS